MGIGAPQKIFGSVKSFSARGRLLSKAELQTLAESRNLDELVTRIKSTVYINAVSKLTKPITAEKIESALRSHLADIHYSLAKSVGGGSKVLNVYYLKFLIWNLKLIFKGKVLGRSYEEIEPYVNLHAEELMGRRDIVVKALVAKDIEEAVSGLATSEFGEEIAKAVSLYNEKKNLQIFDTYLDKVFYKQLESALKSSGEHDLVHVVGTDIDFYNILSILRGKFWGLDEQQIQDFIVTHTPLAPKDLLGRMISAESVKDAISELSSTVYKDLVPQKDNAIDVLSEFERSFELAIYKSLNRTFTRMFSFSTVIAILKLTMYEIRNISAIAFAVEQQIPVQTVMSKLIIAE